MHHGSTLMREGPAAPLRSAEPVSVRSFSAERRKCGEDASRCLSGIIRVRDCSHDDDTRGAGIYHPGDVAEVDATDREPRQRAASRVNQLCRVTHEFEAHRGAAGFGRSGPHRSDTEVVQSVGGQCGVDLLGAVAGQADRCRRIDKAPCRSKGQVELPNVEHRGFGQHRDVGPIVHRPESTVAFRHRPERLEQFEFLGGFDVLIPQLDDVDTAAECRMQKVSEVCLPSSGVGAQVEAGMIEAHSIHARGDRWGNIS